MVDGKFGSAVGCRRPRKVASRLNILSGFADLCAWRWPISCRKFWEFTQTGSISRTEQNFSDR